MTVEPKPSWNEVPDPLKAEVARLIGAPVAEAEIVWGGYGPSATFVLTAADGRRVFCKGTHPGQTRQGHQALLKERQNHEAYPELAAFTTTYRGGADHGDWHVALFDYAKPLLRVPPWTDEAVSRVLELMARFHESTPARVATDPAMQGNAQIFYDTFGWKSLIADDAARRRFLALFADTEAAARWFAQNATQLEAVATRPVGGPQSWLHLDIRSDNLVFAERLHLVDWPLLSYGPVINDVAAFLPSLEGEGGPSCADALQRYERAAGVSFAAGDVSAAAAGIAGFFAARAGEPPIPGLPRLRWIQKVQLFPALNWASDCLGIARPPLPRPFTA